MQRKLTLSKCQAGGESTSDEGQAEVRPGGFALAPLDEGVELCAGGRER